MAYLEESRHWQLELTPAVTIKYDVLGLTPTRTGCRLDQMGGAP